MDRGAWKAMDHRIAKSQTRLKWLSTHARTAGVLRGTDEFSKQGPIGIWPRKHR